VQTRFLTHGALLAWLLAGLGCAHAFNYADPGGPGCALDAAARPAADGVPGAFDVVSFNIRFGKDPEGALRTLQRVGWAGADVYVLQEVDWRSTLVIARGLARERALNAVYYPAAQHPAAGRRQFGVAIVSRWPIRSDQKILLPDLSRMDRSQKVSLGATVWVAGVPVGVTSVHLQSSLSPAQVERQAALLFGCAVRGECPEGTPPPSTPRAGYVVAGDFNTWSQDHVSRVATAAHGFELDPVGGIKGTFGFLLFRPTLDLLFAGAPVVPLGRGEVSRLHDGSDHYPVRGRFRLPLVEPWQGFERDVLRAGASRDDAVCIPVS
jgi:endonuclease/exonuclease/phosphatase family metal-dependent hydrolase